MKSTNRVTNAEKEEILIDNRILFSSNTFRNADRGILD